MKKTLLVLGILGIAVIPAMVACKSGAAKTGEKEIVISTDSLVKRGSYLVNAVGCDDCHTPKKFGPHGHELDFEHRFGGCAIDEVAWIHDHA